jgi:hypothetical protein
MRFLLELRNGDGNFLNIEGKRGKFVACTGADDVEALEAAFLNFISLHKERRERLNKIVEERRTPGRD